MSIAWPKKTGVCVRQRWQKEQLNFPILRLNWSPMMSARRSWLEYTRYIPHISVASRQVFTSSFSSVFFIPFHYQPLIKGVDACQGDSGGPASVLKGGRQTQVEINWKELLRQHVPQIGIVSLGKGCGDPRFPGLYTRVSSLLAWLKKITSGYNVWNSSCQKI